MNANELRIGNIILDAINNDIVIVDLNTFNYINNGRTAYQPIPLTEEILLKCGFEIKYDKYYGIDKGSLYFSAYDFLFVGSGFQIFDDQSIKVTELQYLHQLQNLYFALTGEELNVNL